MDFSKRIQISNGLSISPRRPPPHLKLSQKHWHFDVRATFSRLPLEPEKWHENLQLASSMFGHCSLLFLVLLFFIQVRTQLFIFIPPEYISPTPHTLPPPPLLLLTAVLPELLHKLPSSHTAIRMPSERLQTVGVSVFGLLSLYLFLGVFQTSVASTLWITTALPIQSFTSLSTRWNFIQRSGLGDLLLPVDSLWACHSSRGQSSL